MAKAERTVIKKVTNAVLYSDGTIRLDNVRASHPHLDKPYAGKDDEGKEGKAKFGIIAMLPKKTHTAAKDLVKEAINSLAKENDAKVATDKWFLRNGDDSDREEYEGHFVISARESKRPSVRDRRGSVMTVEEIEQAFYGGCWVNVFIRPWYQDGVKVGKGYGKRMNAGLVAVQFVRDDEAFGDARITDDGVFDEVDDNDFDDDDDGDL